MRVIRNATRILVGKCSGKLPVFQLPARLRMWDCVIEKNRRETVGWK
jgi:hypothetical protein